MLDVYVGRFTIIGYSVGNEQCRDVLKLSTNDVTLKCQDELS